MSTLAKPIVAWDVANQRHLVSALGLVRFALERHVGQTPTATLTDLRREISAAEKVLPAPSALQRVTEGFQLSPFEQAVLLLCAGCELDAAFSKLCAAALRDEHRTSPTFALALAALPEAHWTALSPEGALRNWKLLEVGAGEQLVNSPLRIDERVLHFLTGVQSVDTRLRAMLDRVSAPDQLVPSHVDRARQLADLWEQGNRGGALPAVQLVSRDTTAAVAIAATACASVRLSLQAIRASELPTTPADRDSFARLWEREAILGRNALLIEVDAAATPEAMNALLAVVDATAGPVVVLTEENVRLRTRPLARIEVRPPAASEQRTLWTEALGPAAKTLNGQVDVVSTHFQLGAAGVRAASAAVRESLAAKEKRPVETLLWDACRAQTRPKLEGLARRIEALATWDDLVLPTAQRQTLRTIAAHVRQRSRVYESWGFSSKSERGLGISALFSGTSGTGKTMAAEVLANELRLDLYRIDLSSLVSKYIGETEKNLRRVFDAAEAGGAILLFDEADAIFGRRSEVRDSHDRYANIEVGYLLQRVEAYRGLVILTTNQPQSLDAAFSRRIRFTVQFPFPDLAQRAEIWRRVFPKATPTEGLRVEKLAKLNIAGGHIRNLALNAAFLAADTDEPVRMKHLLAAAQSEFVKLEKPLSEAETAGWL
jgi:hypothetical protein